MLDPERHKKKTARNRSLSAQYLTQNGIAFESRNDGAHLILRSRDGKTVNFWPGTGLFIAERLSGRGVRNLVKILRGEKKWKEYQD